MSKNQIASQNRDSNKSYLLNNIESREHLIKQVAKGGGFAFIGIIISKVSILGLHILLGRVIGPGAYGLYALGMSVMGIALILALFGQSEGTVRFCSIYRGEEDNARVKGTIISAMAISIVCSVIATVILFSMSDVIANRFFHKPELTWVLRIIALSLPVYVLMNITTSFTQAYRRIDYQQGVLNIFHPWTNLTLVGVAFLLGCRLDGALYSFLIAGILSAILGFYFMKKILSSFHTSVKPRFEVWNLLRFTAPLSLSGFLYLMILQIDRIMLGYFQSAYDVGIYNAAAVIALQVGTFAFHPLAAITTPIMADLHNRDQIKELRAIFQTVTRWMFTLALPLLIIVGFFAKEIMSWFGTDFGNGWLILIILSFSRFIFVSVGPTSELLKMSGRQYIDLINNVCLLSLIIGLNLWLIPLHGIVGAAVATAISVVIYNIVQLIEVILLLKINPYSTKFLKPVIIALGLIPIGIIFLYTIGRNMWVLNAALLMVSYFTVYYLFGLNTEEKLIFTSITNKLLPFLVTRISRRGLDFFI